MKIFNNGALISLLSLIAVSANAAFTNGPSSGGGGFVVDCPANVLEPAKVELLDLYEARQKLGFITSISSANLVEDYFQSVDRTYTMQGSPDLAEQLRTDIDQNLKNFFRSVKEVQPSELPRVNDLGNLPWIPASCQIKQVAFFDDNTETIHLDRSLFDRLDSLNQAALVQHELWYEHLRTLQDETSELARLAVGHTFALRGVIPVDHEIPEGARKFTTSGSSIGLDISSFHAYPVHSGMTTKMLRLQFSQLQGRAQLTKTYVHLPWHAWDLKFGRSKSKASFVGCIVQTPQQNIQQTVPVLGTMSEGLSLKYTYQTGEPIRLTLLNKGKVVSEGYVGNDCRGF